MGKFPLTREEKERKVIELYERGMNTREISKRVRLSFSDIGQITRKLSGDQSATESSKKNSKRAQAFELFRRGAKNLETAIKLDISYDETIDARVQYTHLIGADRFCEFYNEMKGDLESHLSLSRDLKFANVSVSEAIKGVIYARQQDQIKFEITGLQNNLEELKRDIYVDSQLLNALNKEKNSLIAQVEALKEAKNTVLSELDTMLGANQMPPTVEIPKRRIWDTQELELAEEKGSTIGVRGMASSGEMKSRGNTLVFEQEIESSGYEIVEVSPDDKGANEIEQASNT